MSLLAEKTEKSALYELAKSLKFFENLNPLWVSAEDAFAARSAENLIRSVIENNGYVAIYCKRKGTRLIKYRH